MRVQLEAGSGIGLGPRLAVTAGVLFACWGVVHLTSEQADVDLVVVLLPLVIVTMILSALVGRLLGIVAALLLGLLVNWYLLPPVHTLWINGVESFVALLAFVLAGTIASILMEAVGRARAREATTREEQAIITEVVENPSALQALDRLRRALALDGARLDRVLPDGGMETLLEIGSPQGTVVVDAPILDGYRIVGRGPERLAADRTFVETLAAVVVRAYEGEQLGEQRRRLEELRVLDEARSALLAAVGHDLRTPLSAVRVAVETLALTWPSLAPADRDELLATIDQSSMRLEELITNLLDMSRIESGAVINHPERTSVEAVVLRAIVDLPESSVAFTMAEGLKSAYCDPALLERVIANLAANAVRHQGGEGSITIEATSPGDEVVISVVDHGVGIRPEDREAALEPFRRLRPHMDGGAGVGLAVARAFTSAMDGALVLAETPGGGLTVTVRLPCQAGDR